MNLLNKGISIKNIYQALEDDWDLIWSQCFYSTYFHSREWAEIWAVYTGGDMRPVPKIIEFSDGKKALLPLSAQKNLKGLMTQYVLSPAHTFGGWISADDINISHADLMVGYLTKELGNLYWRLNPYDDLALKAGSKVAANMDETHSINLENSFDAISSGITHGHASSVRKASREGVSVKPASTLDDWLGYYRVYQDTLRRWADNASSRYGWGIFEEMYKRNSPYIKLWLAVFKGEVVSGTICLYARTHVAAWHAATLESCFYLRPVNLVMYEAIKDAYGKRYSWFDFNPSGGHEGVKTFKKRFGAKSLLCPEVNIEMRAFKTIKRLRTLF